MPLPTKEKTWEFDPNRWYQHTSTSDEVVAREINLTFKNMIIGASHTAYQGTISLVGGTTFQLVTSDRGGDPTRLGSEDFTTALVGKRVEFVGATSGGNDGVFEITAVTGVDTFEYTNPSGVAEAFIGSIRISNGQFTSGAGSSPAIETLTFTGNALNDETVTIAARVYTFKTSIVGATENTVLIGASASDSLDNLIAAINRDAGEGTLYGGLTRDNFEITAAAGAGDTMDVTAKPRGTRGNSISVSTTVTGASWIGANLAGGVDGYFPAWRVKGSHGNAKGALMDGIDRWQDQVDDLRSSTSGTRSWIVFQNDVTGAELMFWHDTNTTGQQWEHQVVRVSPELGFTGGTTTTAPTAVDDVELNSRSSTWVGHEACANQTWILHMMHSDDGEDTRIFGFAWQTGYFTFMCDTAKDAKKNGALIPWNGSQNIIDWTKTDGNVNLIGNWNDTAQMRATFDKDAAAGGHYEAGMYLASEFYSAATLMENFNIVRDELANEFIMTPVGLAASTVGLRGRHGRMSDFWYTNSYVNAHVPQGSTYPADGSHQFVKIGHFVLPWAGVPFRKQ